MQYRQGDVLLTRVPRAPVGTPVAPVNGHHVLAYGEATGHHHSIPAAGGTLTRDAEGVTYLSVDELVGLTHQEHATITVEPGVYRVTRQREWTDADEPRTVPD